MTTPFSKDSKLKQTIPELVKRQAMSAVGHLETTAMIRRMTAQYPESSPIANPRMKQEQRPYQPLTDEVKRKAMEAVSHPEVRAHVRLLEDTGSIRPPHVPTLRAQPIGKRIDQMYRAGLTPDVVHPIVTKDNFEREFCQTR